MSTTTEALLMAAIGAAVNPGDGISEVDFQRTDITSNFEKHQIWVNWVRVDKTKLLTDLYRNNQLVHVIVVYMGLAVDPEVVKVSLATLSAAYLATIQARLALDSTFGVARDSKIESIMTDGGYMSGGSNPKSSAIIGLRVEWYSVN